MTTASIVTHRTPAAQLLTALHCILRCSDVVCVYVVDNSPDEELRKALAGMERVEYIHVENRGYGAGHNTAIAKAMSAGSSFHLVMNADVRWDGDILSVLTGYLGSEPEAGMVMPKVYYPDGALQYACRMLPTPWDVFAKRFLPSALTRRRMERYLLADADHDKAFDCPYLLGSFLLFRTDALRKVGTFDERFFMYPEDIDITRRVHASFRTMFYPAVSIVHDHAAASRKSLRMLRIHIVNMVRYFNKWGWFVDTARRKANKKLLRDMPRLSGRRPAGRG